MSVLVYCLHCVFFFNFWQPALMGFSLYWQPAIVNSFFTLANKLLLLLLKRSLPASLHWECQNLSCIVERAFWQTMKQRYWWDNMTYITLVNFPRSTRSRRRSFLWLLRLLACRLHCVVVWWWSNLVDTIHVCSIPRSSVLSSPVVTARYIL